MERCVGESDDMQSKCVRIHGGKEAAQLLWGGCMPLRRPFTFYTRRVSMVILERSGLWKDMGIA